MLDGVFLKALKTLRKPPNVTKVNPNRIEWLIEKFNQNEDFYKGRLRVFVPFEKTER